MGDNDRLAAMVTNLLRAPLLVLLSDVDGLFDGNPSDPQSPVISTVTNLDETIREFQRQRAAAGVSGQPAVAPSTTANAAAAPQSSAPTPRQSPSVAEGCPANSKRPD